MSYLDTLNKRDEEMMSSNNSGAESKPGFEPIDHANTRLTILGDEAGTARMTDARGNRLLIPSPSNDPNDPLNWSNAQKWWITILVCCAIFCCNAAAAGPSIAILETVMEFRVGVAQAAYLFTAAIFVQGMSLLFWSPMIAKFGKRVVYISSFTLYTIFVFAAGASKTYNAQLATRIVMAFFCGAGEALGPLTIADIWFVDERAFPLAFYTASLSIGVGLTLLVDGWIAQNLGVQAIYWVTGSMIAMITVLVIFTFPETSFTRGPQRNVVRGEPRNIDKSGKMSYLTSLKPHSGQVWTQDSWLKLIIRPVALVCWPATLWAILIFAVDVGALAAVTTNVASAAGATYYWGPGLSGSAFAASVIGSILGVGGGALSDWWAVRQTKRNGGVREPEMRLLPMLPAIITMPLGLVLYGLGFQDRLHWIVFTIGLGLLSFSVTWTTGIALAYMIDTIRPLAEEAITSVLAIKAAVAFLLSFYTNPWIADQGQLAMWGEFAAIATAVILLVFVFMFAGKPIRTKALQWRVIQAIKWHEDRDDVIVEDD